MAGATSMPPGWLLKHTVTNQQKASGACLAARETGPTSRLTALCLPDCPSRICLRLQRAKGNEFPPSSALLFMYKEINSNAIDSFSTDNVACAESEDAAFNCGRQDDAEASWLMEYQEF